MTFLVERDPVHEAQLSTLELLTGSLIGSGSCRDVYALPMRFEFRVGERSHWGAAVMKVATSSAGISQNSHEFEIWDRVNWVEDLAPWFAPVWGSSDDGRVIVMQRAGPAPTPPYKVPACLTDLKLENFGRIGTRFVAIDYGLTRCMEKGLSKAMRRYQGNDPEF